MTKNPSRLVASGPGVACRCRFEASAGRWACFMPGCVVVVAAAAQTPVCRALVLPASCCSYQAVVCLPNIPRTLVLPLPPNPPFTNRSAPPCSLPSPQWNAKVYETKAACQQVYNAARPVLAAIHDVPLEG